MKPRTDRRRNDARTREIVALRRDGWKRAAIAARLAVHETTVAYHVRKAGISLPVGRPRQKTAQQRTQQFSDARGLVHGEAR